MCQHTNFQFQKCRNGTTAAAEEEVFNEKKKKTNIHLNICFNYSCRLFLRSVVICGDLTSDSVSERNVTGYNVVHGRHTNHDKHEHTFFGWCCLIFSLVIRNCRLLLVFFRRFEINSIKQIRKKPVIWVGC